MSTVSHTWNGDADRADRVLTALGMVRSRTAARQSIEAGRVTVDGLVIHKAGAKIQAGQELHVTDVDRYVSRGAYKLLAALEQFTLEVAGKVALDVGASTGGFTQVLIEHGADLVLAIDVGHGQMREELANHPRVRLWEGCNARYLTAADLAHTTGESRPPTLIVGDLSFISLTQVLPAMVAVMDPRADLVLLIKPQFEVGKEGIGDGVVTDPARQFQAIERVVTAAEELGLTVLDLALSPTPGTHGNREFLIHMRRGEACDGERLHEMMSEAVYGERSTRE